MEIRYKQMIEGIKLTTEEKSSLENTLRILHEIIQNTKDEDENGSYCNLYLLADRANDALTDLYYDDRIITREE